MISHFLSNSYNTKLLISFDLVFLLFSKEVTNTHFHINLSVDLSKLTKAYLSTLSLKDQITDLSRP